MKINQKINKKIQNYHKSIYRQLLRNSQFSKKKKVKMNNYKGLLSKNNKKNMNI